jgi:hypothetical protein
MQVREGSRAVEIQLVLARAAIAGALPLDGADASEAVFDCDAAAQFATAGPR